MSGVDCSQHTEIDPCAPCLSQAFIRALEIDPTYDEAWNNLGAGYEKLSQWNNAVDAYASTAGRSHMCCITDSSMSQ
jgi:hypothetical protein